MQKHSLKFGKVFTSVACTPLILISNNSELAAKYLPNNGEQTIKTFKKKDIKNGLLKELDNKQKKNLKVKANLIA